MVGTKHPLIGPELTVERIINEKGTKLSLKHLASKLVIMEMIISAN
jgi:hypothetical protein